jgi:patatin-like phospholipase/acyl hydrolase
VGELSEFIREFADTLDGGKAVTLDDLTTEVGGALERCNAARERIVAARASAEAEITAKLDESADTAVRRLAQRLHKDNLLPSRQKATDARTHQEAHEAVNRYQADITKLGESLCDRRELFDVYLEIARDHAQGVDGEQLMRKYGEEKLRALSERKLVTLRTVVEL